MKHALALATTIVILAASNAGVAAEHMSGMKHEMHEHDSVMSEGMVKKLDKAAGKLTLAHGPLQNLDMPAMTMVFKSKDPACFDKLKVGDKIRFVAQDVQGTLTVERCERMK